MTTNNPDDLILRSDAASALQDMNLPNSSDMWIRGKCVEAINSIPAARSDKGEAEAYLVTYREVSKSGSVKVCTEPLLENKVPMLTFALENVASREFISSKPLFTTPQQAIPAEPTKEMMHAFYSKPVPQYSFTEAYKAMLSAAPTSPIDNGVRTCDWEGGYDDSMPSTYKGTCGIVWSFIEDGLAENDCKFCPRCGGKITDITVHLESDE
jgi:hypothetical protein